MQKIIKIHIALVVLLLCLVPLSAFAKSGTLIRSAEGVVTHVSDGDTIKVITDNGTVLKVRLAGMDAPETPKVNRKTGSVNKPGQPYGENATAFYSGYGFE